MRTLKHRIINKNTNCGNSEFLFRRHRKGPSIHKTDAEGRLSRSKVSEK